MNPTKHPRFIKDLPAANLLLAETCPLAETILETLVFAGIDPDQPVYTRDGDRVRLLCVDHDHQFPILGEVIDFDAENSWLARWSASGVYAGGSQQSIARHSLATNAPLGGIVEPACGCVVCHEVHVEIIDFALPPLMIVEPIDLTQMHITVADIGRESLKAPLAQNWRMPSGSAVVDNRDHMKEMPPSSGAYRYVPPVVNPLFDTFKKLEPAARAPQTPPPAPIPMSFPPINLKTADVVELERAHAPPAVVDPSITNAVLSDWPLPLGAEVQAESAEVIGRAKRTVAKWTRDHAEYPNLRGLVAPLIDLTKIEKATTDAYLTPAAHLWSLVAFYAMAGRLRLAGEGPGAIDTLTPLSLQRIVDGCKRVGPTGTYGYWVGASMFDGQQAA